MGNALAFQNDMSKRIQQADSLLKHKAYQLSKAQWIEIVSQTSEDNSNYFIYKSKLLYCEAKLLQEDGNYTDAIETYHSVQHLLNKDTASGTKLFRVEVYSGLYHSLAYSGQWDKALEKGTEGLFLIDASVDPQTQADYIYDLGYINDRLKNYSDAINLYQQAIATYKTLENKHFDLGLAYNNLATVYKQIGFFTERLKSYEQAKAYWETDSNIDPSYLITLYGNMLKLYMEYGDATKAKDLFRAIHVLADSAVQPGDKVNILRLQVIYHTFSNNLYKAEEELEKFTDYFFKLPQKESYSQHYLAALIDLADCYILEGQDQKASITLTKVLSLCQDFKQPYYCMLAYAQYTKLATYAKDYPTAISYLDASLELNEQSPIGLVNVVNIMIQKASLQLKQDEVVEANRTMKEALSVLAEKKVNTPRDVTVETFEQQHSSFFIVAMRDAANFYRDMYYQTQEHVNAQYARYLYEMAAEIFGLYYQNGEYNANLNRLNTSINEGIYQMYTILQRPLSEQVLTRMEQNNSQVLRNEFERKHVQFLTIDTSLLAQRNVLEFELKNSKEGNDSLTNVQKKLQEAITKLDAVIADKAPMYESFYKEDISLQKIQQYLGKEELLVKYFIGNKRVYALTISQNSIALFDLVETEALKENLNSFYTSLSDPKTSILSQSRELYVQLIEPFQQILKHFKTLTILPNDVLHYLPFEVLQTGNTLLIDMYNIQYANSLSLWYFLKSTPHQSKSNKNLLAAFAPQYGLKGENNVTLRGNRFEDLEGARMEAKKIANMVKGDLYLNKEATIKNFMNQTAAYNIYHLAMHAVLDNSDYTKSGLVFNENALFDVSSFYSLYFPADLVVLSACNTGVGQLTEGEGLLNLSNALTYSGVRASVYSLWEVPDKETSEIMVSFYRYLETGTNKTEALANAKRDFIKNNPLKAHPYYWAGFVLNGDSEPILKANNQLAYIVLALVFVGGTVFFKRFMRSKQSV